MWTPLVHRKIRQTASNTCCRRNTDWLKPPDLTLTDWNYPTWHWLTETTRPQWHWLTETIRPDTDWLKLPDLTLTDWNHPTWLTETTRSDTDWNHPTWHWLKPPDKAQLVHSLSYSYLLLLPVFLSFFFPPFFLLFFVLPPPPPPFFFFWKMVALHWHMTFGRYHGFGDQLYFSLLSLCLFIAVHDGEILHLKCCLNRNCLLQYSLSL